MYNFKLHIPCNRASKQIKQEFPKAQVDVHITGILWRQLSQRDGPAVSAGMDWQGVLRVP